MLCGISRVFVSAVDTVVRRIGAQYLLFALTKAG